MTRPGKGMNPATVTQVRRFTYNANGQTTSITHPENGTVNFTYNPDGTLQQKTDAKGQRIVWTYTPEGRPATVRKFAGASDATEDFAGRVDYTYGSQTVDPTFAGTNLQGRPASVSTYGRGGRIDELYSYNVAGAVLRKRMRITRGMSIVTKDIDYTYDAEGKLLSTKYPDEQPFVMTYDALARPNGLTQQYQPPGLSDWFTRNWVSGGVYGVAGELREIRTFAGVQGYRDTFFTETREYNERMQMTRQRATHGSLGSSGTFDPVAMDLRYVFTTPSSPNNDGRILQRDNVVSGETVTYTYDALQRLEKAETASAAWGLSWDYDGFGNRWEQRVTKGTAPPNTVSFDQTTNRVNSAWFQHDANGNMTAMPGYNNLTYDIDNRLLSANGNGSWEQYAYLADNKRVWKQTNQNGNLVEQY
jgi:YD repeat-containing protein